MPEVSEDEIDAAYNCLVKGQELLLHHEYEAALASFQEAHRLIPEDTQPYYLIGYALMSLRRPDEALSYLQEAIRVDPSNLAAYTAAAKTCAMQGDRKAQQEYLRQAARLPEQSDQDHKRLTGRRNVPLRMITFCCIGSATR